MATMTTNNPILDELRATRERLLAESGGTLSGLAERLRAEEAVSDRPKYSAQKTNRALPSSAQTDSAQTDSAK